MNLYDIGQDWLETLNAFDPETGEIPADYDERINAIEASAAEKVENICRYIAVVEGQSDMLSGQLERLSSRKSVLQNKIKRLKTYLHDYMSLTKQYRIEADTFTVRLQANPPSLYLPDPESVADEFKSVQQVVKIDKNAIKNALKRGANLSFPAELRQTEGVRIK